MKNSRKILVTSALPYANGSLHLGHLVETIQTDIWVRFQKLRGHEVLYLCADDAHGTPIMLSAEKEGITPEELISRMHDEHVSDFNDFQIKFDNYHSTHSPENEELVAAVYKRLQERGDIVKKSISQAYDPVKEMFLPDRYVKGTCPRCGTEDQYGDSCESCGATYSPTELKNPVSVLSGEPPIEKESEHFFFQLPNYTSQLAKWMSNGHLQEHVANKMKEWFTEGLREWDITRDAPYFGFKIPGEEDKYFYVWVDAPIGYMASLKNLCDKTDLNFDDFWNEDSDWEVHHFVGKDIIYFHALFWPALLMSAGFRTPTAIVTHGFLTVDGKKMSKSRGTFIKARTYLNHLSPEYIRYYYACKLNNSIGDIDLNLEDLVQRVNSDLVGKVVNIASRCASFITKYFDSELASTNSESQLVNDFITAGESIAAQYEAHEFGKAVREIMELADKANHYIDEQKPWVKAKDPEQQTATQEICTVGLNLFRILMIYLQPVLPHLTEQTEEFLNISPVSWDARGDILLKHKINPFKPMLQRIQPESIAAIKEEATVSE